MKRRVTVILPAIAALALGASWGAQAAGDAWADTADPDSSGNTLLGLCGGVACDAADVGNSGNDVNAATEAPDDSSVRLGTGGTLGLNFSNVCFIDDDDTTDDLTVYEDTNQGNTNVEATDVDVVIGGVLTGAPVNTGTGGTVSVDLTDSAANDSSGVTLWYQSIKITDDTTLGGTGAGAGAEIDAVECLWTLLVTDIEKAFVLSPEDTSGDETFIEKREKGDFDVQHKAFSITIENNTGLDDAFADLLFKDAVPAEYDLDPDAESPSGDAANDDCLDGDCDGIAHELDGDDIIICPVTASRNAGASRGKNAGNKLEPELLDIDASGLEHEDSCTNTVYVVTEDGHKKSATPTSCPVLLNSGVKVFSATMDLLLQGDPLIFGPAADYDPDNGEGWCDDGVEDPPEV